MIPGDDVTYSDENNNEDFLLVKKKKEKVKEEILDETFKKAEFLKNTQSTKEKKKTSDKPFFKSGIIIIIIAIVALALITFTPWMYAKYDIGNASTQQFFYKDFQNEEIKNNKTLLENITNLFDSPCKNCTNNSQNYIGLTIKDFGDIPKLTSYGLVALIIMGLIFTIFVIIDRFRNFSFEKSYLVCSIFAASYVVTSVFILLLSIKFLASHFLLYYNEPFIRTSGLTNVTLIFLAPIILVFFSSAIMKGSMTVMKINFREVEKRLESEQPEKNHSTFRYGGAKI
jgi:hypothetical protein